MSEGKIFQFSDHQREKQELLRREYERILFRRILGCYTVIESLGLKPVELEDISKSGCGFKMDPVDGVFNAGEEIDFRFYFSSNTFVAAKLTIVRVDRIEDPHGDGFYYGCRFDKTVKSYEAVEKFVDFIEAYSRAARQDKGDHKLFQW